MSLVLNVLANRFPLAFLAEERDRYMIESIDRRSGVRLVLERALKISV